MAAFEDPYPLMAHSRQYHRRALDMFSRRTSPMAGRSNRGGEQLAWRLQLRVLLSVVVPFAAVCGWIDRIVSARNLQEHNR